MTKHERAQVVELLRCAADIELESMSPLTKAFREIYGVSSDAYGSPIWKNARDARIVVEMEAGMVGRWPTQHTALLEAAARVEEKSWP